MITIHVEDRDGTKRTLAIDENPSGSLMEILTAENFDVPAICGGIAGCGTCHIYVLKGGEKLEMPEDDEMFMLDTLSNYTPQSRLSCQISLTRALDGAEIQVRGDGE
ncbi:MAG: 2Fe-2S iron-sulfur cluster-binding protein [Bacteroidia bacterium]|nr:2Fe-2S iron-sulfur cluster-binding protein [Bacteroidia bacterium]